MKSILAGIALVASGSRLAEELNDKVRMTRKGWGCDG